MIQPPIAQAELLRRSASEIEAIRTEAQRLTGSLTSAQLRWAPPEGGWSVAQVLDHVVTASSSYFERMQGAAAGGRMRSGEGRPWKPSFFGGMLIRSLEPANRKKYPSPKVWRPEQRDLPDALPAFLEAHRTLAGIVSSAAEVDLVRTRLSSPVSRLIRLNLGDAIRVLIVHAQRHLGQAERLIARPDFPGAAAPAAPPQ